MPILRPPMVGSGPDIRIRSVGRVELPKLLDIFSKAIPHTQLGRSIYLAPRVEMFLAALLDHPRLHAHEQLWGVELEREGLVGGAHTRLIGECHHLNNYAVLPAFQGRGLGARMMAYWHELAGLQRAHILSLDVDLDNDGARRHYASHGFRDASRSSEYRFDGSVKADLDGVQLHDWPLARAAFEAYGFGRFTLSAGPDRCSVDLRVGAFRLSSSEPQFLAAVRAMDPVREIIVRTTEHLDSRSWALTGTIVRMVKELS